MKASHIIIDKWPLRLHMHFCLARLPRGAPYPSNFDTPGGDRCVEWRKKEEHGDSTRWKGGKGITGRLPSADGKN